MKSIAQQVAEMEKQTLNELISYLGGPARLAEFLGVTRQIVYYWQKRGRISASAAIDVERLTDGKFKKSALRPAVTQWRSDK